MLYIDKAKRIATSRRKAYGAVAVEFALLLIPLLLIVAGIVEFGKTFWYYDALAKATRDGARLMSMADMATITNTQAVANGMVVAAANNARVSPPLATVNVSVECLNASYAVQTCVNGTAPANVRVTIVLFDVRIGGWIPFVTLVGAPWVVRLSPYTTMRYMR